MNKYVKVILGGVGGIILLLIVDFICILTINKPLFAFKQDNGDSINIIYKGLFYDTYICHEYSVPQIKMKRAKYTCAHIKFTENKKSTYTITKIDNITTNITDISLTGATIIIKDTNKTPCTYGQWYKIEKQVNGIWYEVKPIIDNYVFNDIGYVRDKNNEVKFIIDWEWLYGELTQGSYRILKQVDNKYISIEFGIATTS